VKELILQAQRNADFYRMTAATHERNGEPAIAVLLRNEAYILENGPWTFEPAS
jgi:hypothetical protein